MSPCHGEDRRFKSDRGRHFFYLFLGIFIYLYIFASVAQSVEQRTENPCVGSSILPWGTIYNPHADVVEWQTRHLEGVVSVRSYGFKSHHPHQTRAYSSGVEQPAHNRSVPGSNPGGPTIRDHLTLWDGFFVIYKGSLYNESMSFIVFLSKKLRRRCN